MLVLAIEKYRSSGVETVCLLVETGSVVGIAVMVEVFAPERTVSILGYRSVVLLSSFVATHSVASDSSFRYKHETKVGVLSSSHLGLASARVQLCRNS